MYAAQKGRLALVNKLLQYGADAFLVNTDNNTAQHLTVNYWEVWQRLNNHIQTDDSDDNFYMILTTVFHMIDEP